MRIEKREQFFGYYPVEQAPIPELMVFKNSLNLLRQNVGILHTGITNTKIFTETLSQKHRRELTNQSDIFKLQAERAETMSQEIEQRMDSVVNGKFIFIAVRDAISNEHGKTREIFASDQDPLASDNKGKMVKGILLDLRYGFKTEPDVVSLFAREVIGIQDEGGDKLNFVHKENQDEHITLSQEKPGRNGYLEAYLQSIKGRFPLSEVDSIEFILSKVNANIEEQIIEALRPEVREMQVASIFNGLGNMAVTVIHGKNKK